MKTLPFGRGAGLATAARTPPAFQDEAQSTPAQEDRNDRLSRNVYGLLGIPIDAISFTILLGAIQDAADRGAPFLISTPNVNFLVKSQESAAFRESLLCSHLCLADGMPLIWIARLLGIPLPERIAGADLFSRLKSAVSSERPLRVFLVGGAEGVAAEVRDKLNAEQCGLRCVGALNPGYGTIEEISAPAVLDQINENPADLLAVFFGAEKAQGWLMHNAQRLRPPIRAQFGATINFEAGRVRRAPRFMRSNGLEWLWRIKEEPYLWRRYFNDGRALLGLLAGSVLPLMLEALRSRRSHDALRISVAENANSVTVGLAGDATAAHVDGAILQFRTALAAGKSISIDLSEARRIDARFFGLLLTLRQALAEGGNRLDFTGLRRGMRRLFRLNRFEFLLSQTYVAAPNIEFEVCR